MQAVFLAKAGIGDGFVHFGSLEHEFDVAEVNLVNEVPDAFYAELGGLRGVVAGVDTVVAAEDGLAVLVHANDVGVGVDDDDFHGVGTPGGIGFHV